MSPSEDLIVRRKVKDERDAAEQASRLADALEEAEFSYELGASEQIFIKIRRYLEESVSFYFRHKGPDSNMQGLAKRQLKLANKLALSVLVKCLNQMLTAANQPVIVLPTSVSTIETACHKLFYFLPGGDQNVGQSTSGGSPNDGKKNTSLIPLV